MLGDMGKAERQEQRFEEVEHVADLALRARGRDRPELFANAAEGMFSLIGDCRRDLPAQCQDEIRLEAPDVETLLIDWLNELLYLSEARAAHYFSFDVRRLTSTSLVARVGGNPSTSREQEIKSATFHNLYLSETADGFEATIVFDV